MVDRELAELGASVLRHGAQGVIKHLETSKGWNQLSLAEDQFHTGDDPIVADGEAQDVFARYAENHPGHEELRIWGVVGEENIVAVPDSLSPGSRVIVVDPLDGSTPWTLIRAGYCVAALMLIVDAQGNMAVEAAVIANPIHTFTLLGHDNLFFGPTFGGRQYDVRISSCLPENQLSAPSLAFAGYKPKDRNVALSIMTNLSDWSVFTLGGNPMCPYVVVGGLTAAATLRPQCTWDAIGVLMAAATDAFVGTLDGVLIPGTSFRRLFAKVVLTGNVKVIPATVVAKTEQRLREVCSAIHQGLDGAGGFDRPGPF